MIKMTLVFLLFSAIFFCLIRVTQYVTGEQLWSVAKQLMVSMASAALAVLVLTGIVLIF